VKRLTRRQILLIHEELLTQTGGARGIRDASMLDAAIQAPYAGFGDDEFYPTVQAKAARLAFALINDHPFVDGNKRIGITAMVVLLGINDYEVEATDDDLITLGFGLATGQIESTQAEQWVVEHSHRRG